MLTIKFTSDIVSPVTPAELQSWLELPETDTKLQSMCDSATDAVTTYLRRAILPLDITMTVSGMAYFVRKSERFDGYPYVELPYADLVSVDSVTLDGEVPDYETDSDHTPARLHLYGSGIQDRLIVEYTAGMYATANDVPPAIKTAVLMVAAYMYEHRGMCDAKEAIANSGAVTYLRRYRIEAP